MIDQPSQDAQVVENVKGTTKIGIAQLSNPTPMWVTWVFRVEFVLNKFLLFILGASSLFTSTQVKESLVWIAAVDLFIWGIGRFIGISKDQMEDAK